MPTAISWTHETWNPVTGCTRVSPGCAHCYIERQTPMRVARRRFQRVGNAETTGVVLHPERLNKLPPATRGPLIFTCSMSDLFHEEVPDSFIAAVFDVARRHPERVFQVLTKRPERALRWFAEHWPPPRPSTPHLWAEPLPNVWMGVTIENARYTARADVLREIPAAVRFVSAEPLLGSLVHVGLQTPACDRCSLGVMDATNSHLAGVCGCSCHRRRPLDLAGIDWLICGGESGPGHRPLDLDHARELRDACQAAGVAYFFKQVGGAAAKSGGKMLDGREWCEMPRALEPVA